MIILRFQENQAFPDRIILFRDGVGDGQLELAKNTEVAQILEGCKYLDAKPKFTFCVVQKRINARMFVQVTIWKFVKISYSFYQNKIL